MAPISPISGGSRRIFRGRANPPRREFPQHRTHPAAANAVIERDRPRLGKTLYTRKPDGAPIEIIRFHNGETEAREIMTEIVRRRAEGVAWGEFAVLYRSNTLSRLFEESLMRAAYPTRSSATSVSISAPRSRTPWPCSA